MSYRSFYHLTGDGAVIKEFILSEADERAAFNLTGVCAFHSGVTVVAFGHEDTHPHTLLHGTREACMEYKYLFESSYLHHAVRKRKAPVQLNLDLDLLDIKDENHLMNVGTYTVIQASKDGKRIMPYDDLRGQDQCIFVPRDIFQSGVSTRTVPSTNQCEPTRSAHVIYGRSVFPE